MTRLLVALLMGLALMPARALAASEPGPILGSVGRRSARVGHRPCAPAAVEDRGADHRSHGRPCGLDDRHDEWQSAVDDGHEEPWDPVRRVRWGRVRGHAEAFRSREPGVGRGPAANALRCRQRRQAGQPSGPASAPWPFPWRVQDRGQLCIRGGPRHRLDHDRPMRRHAAHRQCRQDRHRHQQRCRLLTDAELRRDERLPVRNRWACRPYRAPTVSPSRDSFSTRCSTDGR